jgi:glucosamine kinase
VTRVLGLDIGGSQSRAQLCNDGEVVAESQAASASVVAAGAARAGSALADLLAQLPLDRRHSLDAVCAGSAGNSVPATREFLTSNLAPLTRSGTVLVVSDAMLVLPAAGLRAGIAVICGTGSIAIGSYQGAAVQAGGWGYLLGDEGSGYWIVRSAIRALLDRRDRGIPLGQLGERLLAATGAADVAKLQELFYDQPQPRDWAAHAPLVLDSADEAVTGITAAAASALASLAVSAAERLVAPVSLPVVLAGGLFGHGGLEAAVRTAITRARPGSDVRTLAAPPVTGAVRLAQEAAQESARESAQEAAHGGAEQAEQTAPPVGVTASPSSSQPGATT